MAQGECFVMSDVVSCVHPVTVLNAAYLHDFQFVNAGRGCKRRLYGRDILQSWSDIIGST